MKVKILFCILLSVIFIMPFGCDDDEKMASLEGSWQGTRAQGEVLVFGVPSGFDEEDNTFDPVLEFKEKGVVTVTHDGTSSDGTWSQDGEVLTMSPDLNTSFVDISGTYTIQTLTATSLVLRYEREGVYNDPDTGIEIEGSLRASLYFTKK